MKTGMICAGLTLAMLGGAAHGQEIALDWIEGGVAGTSISGDGSVIAGNVTLDGSYETFRWVEGQIGVTRLGRATVPVLGTGAGSPDVSDDGTRVSGTILTKDMTTATFGLWTEGIGWQSQDTWPMQPDNANIDNGIASTWGLSGDGEHVTGFYWTTNARAHPATWSPSGGAVPLEMLSPLTSARVNCSNEDGTVVGGWTSSQSGAWRPAVWVNGAITILDYAEVGINMVEAINADGTVLVGQSYDPEIDTRVATVWRWNGTGWDQQRLGTLPGTAQQVGRSTCQGVSADGSVIVGYNAFIDNGPFSVSTGFIWTAETGMRDIEVMLADEGLMLPADYEVSGLYDISADGTAIVGIASYIPNPWVTGTFRIRMLPRTPVGKGVGGVQGSVGAIRSR